MCYDPAALQGRNYLHPEAVKRTHFCDTKLLQVFTLCFLWKLFLPINLFISSPPADSDALIVAASWAAGKLAVDMSALSAPSTLLRVCTIGMN